MDIIEFIIFCAIIGLWFYAFSYLIFEYNGAVTKMINTIKEILINTRAVLVMVLISIIAFTVLYFTNKLLGLYIMGMIALVLLYLAFRYGKDENFKGWE